MLAGILTTSGIIPQIYKAHRTKKTNDVSKGMLYTLISGVLLWTIYGIIKNDIPIIATNSLSFILNGYMLFLLYKLEPNNTARNDL